MTKKLLPLFFISCFCSCFFVIQKKNYFYFSPDIISSFIEGYSSEEKKNILKDLEIIRSVCYRSKDDKDVKKPLYLATAGLPGSGKTTLLEKFMRSEGISSEITYLDPDQRALRFMVHTYITDSLSNKNTTRFGKALSAEHGYNKWRNGAYFITLTLLEECLKKRQNIAHGTTLTKPYAPDLLAAVKKAGYKIIIIFCLADKDIRKKAILHRNSEQAFYQSNPDEEPFIEENFHKNIDSYFTYADTIYLYWSDTLFKQTLAAIFSKEHCNVIDSKALESCIKKLQESNFQFR